MSVAFLFPGQGAQKPGMLRALPQHPAVTATLAETSDALGQDVYELETEEALRSTIATQVSLYVAGVAVARALAAEGVEPDAVAGLSVGAYAAAAVSGAIEYCDGLRLVRKRAQLMANAYPSGYGLSAIVGLDEQQVARLVAACTTPEDPVFLGNLNAPRQIVIAGSEAGMQKVLKAAVEEGARKAERLAVSVPSHCELLQHVAEELEAEMRKLPERQASIPYITNKHARPLRVFEKIRDDLATNIAHSVRWHDTTEVLVSMGTQLFVEMNPGHTLTSLVSEAFPDVRAIAMDASSIAYVARAVRALREDAAV